MRKILNAKEYIAINEDIEKFVKEQLDDFETYPNTSKTVHDAVWGTIDLESWEVELIDLPLFQRLRNIGQVGLAFLTYPTANHSRFEHSLGVLAAANQMCIKINANTSDSVPKISQNNRNKIRLAALLHDIGHCFYSHLSEQIYGELPPFRDLRNLIKEQLNDIKPKPHEILSFMIINSKSFKEYFVKKISYPDKNDVDKLFYDIGKMIIGAKIEENNFIMSYLTDIINGSIDADKLDYIRRDSQTTGIALTYDLDRLLSKICIHQIIVDGKIENRLVLKFSGVNAIEEITFCKIMLHSYIYYHHKVLAADCMVKDYVYGIMSAHKLNSIKDFLRYDDNEILNICDKGNKYRLFGKTDALDLYELSNKIKNRILPKRCFEISQNNILFNKKECIDPTEKFNEMYEKIRQKFSNENYTVSDFRADCFKISSIIASDQKPKLELLISPFYKKDFSALLDEREKVFKEIQKEYEKRGKLCDFSIYDIYLIFPSEVSYKFGGDKIILPRDGSDILSVDDFIKLEDWAAAFNSHKWRGYVSVSNKIDKKIAHDVVSKYILKDMAVFKKDIIF